MGNGGQINTGVKSWKSFGVKSWKSGFDERRLHVASMKPSSLSVIAPSDLLRRSSVMMEWVRLPSNTMKRADASTCTAAQAQARCSCAESPIETSSRASVGGQVVVASPLL